MLAVLGLLVVSRGLSPGLAIPASASSYQTSVSLPPTTNSQSCFQNINVAVAEQSFLTAELNASMLQVAESSSQYAAFVQQTGATPSLVIGGPDMEYATQDDCSVLNVEAFSYSFTAAGQEFSISVSPSTLAVVGRTLEGSAVSFGAATNSSGRWAGWSLYNGTSSSYSTPGNDVPWSYVEANFDAPTVTSNDNYYCGSDPGCTFAIWAGLTNVYTDQYYIAQAGFAGRTTDGGPTAYYLWTQFLGYEVMANECSSPVVAVGNEILAAAYTNVYVNGGSNSTYTLNSYDSTQGLGCLDGNNPFNWSSGMGAGTYFAVIAGENLQSSIDDFTSTSVTGSIYDDVHGGGPSGHCIYTPYNDGSAVAYYDDNGTTSATASNIGSGCTFAIHYDH
jgi:hypothetical protein